MGTGKNELKILSFKNRKLFRRWLSATKSDGIWLRVFKKDSGMETVSYQEALEEALCFGWIDGQRKSHDAASFLQKFTPRRARSLWSKRNTEIVERLVQQKRMTAAGRKAIEAAKADGRWEKAYQSPKNMKIADEHLTAIRKNKKAHAAFSKLSKSDLFAIGFRLHTAKKAETKQRRLKQIIEKLAKGEKI